MAEHLRTDPSGEETNEYAEYPDDNTVGFLLFKTEGDQPHHIHEFLFSEMKKRNDTIDTRLPRLWSRLFAMPQRAK